MVCRSVRCAVHLICGRIIIIDPKIHRIIHVNVCKHKPYHAVCVQYISYLCRMVYFVNILLNELECISSFFLSQREDCFHSVSPNQMKKYFALSCISLYVCCFPFGKIRIRFGMKCVCVPSIRNIFACGDHSIFSLQLRYRYKKERKKRERKEGIIIINFDYIDDTRKKVTVLISIDRILFSFTLLYFFLVEYIYSPLQKKNNDRKKRENARLRRKCEARKIA